MPQTGPVTLAVYDVLGREVAVLASGVYAAGQHEVVWEAAGVPSGVYVYRLEAEGTTMTKTMLLQK